MRLNNLTPSERHKVLVLQYLDGLCKHKYTLAQASESTGHSKQWLCHLKKEYLKYGPDCLVHGNKNRTPVNKTAESLVHKILGIYALPEFKDVNFKTFQDALSDYYGIKIHYNTLRAIFRRANIKSPESHKYKKTHSVHRPRLRRENEGDLLQIDGTPYEWFKCSGDWNKYCMSGSIDDATGKVTALYMTENECLYGIMELIRMTAARHGIPRELYMDRAGWACVTPRLKQSLSVVEQLAGLHEKKTQMQRVFSELNIKQILAWSPQAKGRVERMWETIQGRYPIWAYKHGIKTMADANKHMDEFIDYFNTKFAVSPKSDISFYRELPEDLNDILCAKYPHRTNINGVFMFHSYHFAVMDCKYVANKQFTLCVNESGLTALMDDGHYYPVKLLDDDLSSVYGETMPQVVKNIIYQNMFAFAKEVSA